MKMGLFDVIGPIIHGPSSNHTGGVNRIGYVARCFMGSQPEMVHFLCHPLNMASYSGQHTDVALLAGVLGIREYDPLSAKAMDIAVEKGLTFDFSPLDLSVHRNSYFVHADIDGFPWEIDGISPGGAFIEIIRINGVDVYYDGASYVYYFADKALGAGKEEAAAAAEKLGIKAVSVCCGSHAGYGQVLLETLKALDEKTLEAFERAVCPKGCGIKRTVPPIRSIATMPGAAACYDSFEEMLNDADEIGILKAAFKYEHSLSGASPERIMEEALKELEVEEISTARGLQGGNDLIAGFADGSDAKKIADLGASGRSICGPVFNSAMAKSVAMAEISASAGRIVASPTSGSAGTLPGTLFAAAERFGSTREEQAESYIVSALVGCLMSKECMFTGSGGGCMGEIGCAASMAAAGACYLAGGTPRQIVSAAAIALKNSFGLTCDPAASPVEVPCIKRNAMGAALAIMGAELGLAGVESVIPMDEVIVAFRNIQDQLPVCMRCGFDGGLSITKTGRRMQKEWAEMTAAMNRAEKK
ncbi:MAG: L-serine ammonia-lyase, iron-sulfur-dependent, subunit alpha [Firmicutes bacterium]|nr:L-serine ammonia-lyase, iron-sulfur-dependent, subunit alpha [Bacillota bacterium]